MSEDVAFRERLTEAERSAEALRLRSKYPDRIPIIVEQGARSFAEVILRRPERRVHLTKTKYLVPLDMPFGQFAYIVRKNSLGISPEVGLFVLCQNDMLCMCKTHSLASN